MVEGIGAARRGATPTTDITPIPATDPTIAAAKGGPEYDSQGVNGVPARHTFELDWTDQRGYRWTGPFTCDVLTIAQRPQVGLTRARLLNGVSPHLLDPETLDILEMRAHLAVALVKAPDWMKKLGDWRDINLLGAIYKEVASHERRFWGADDEGAGSGDGEGP